MKEQQYSGIFIGDNVVYRNGYLARVMAFSLQDCKVCISIGGAPIWVPVTSLLKPWQK